MIKVDYHLHSSFSCDSNENLENIINTAIKRGLKEIAITEHLEMQVHTGEFDLNITEYIRTLKKLKIAYKDKIKITIGVELGLEANLLNNQKLNNILENEDIDFIIGSTHRVDGYEIDRTELYEKLSKDEAHNKYFNTVYENIKAINGFNICGHLDYIRRYGRKSYNDYNTINYDYHKEIIEKILKLLISRGQGIEINSSGFRYVGEQHPNDYILKMYKKLGGTIITVGSDSHIADDIAKDFDKINSLLLECGFDSYNTFEGRKPVFEKLN